MITAAKYWKRWADPRLIIAVLNNRDLNMVSWELRALGGAPKVAETQDLPDLDYAAYAELLGLTGLTVDGPGGCRRRRGTRRLAADRPVVIDVKADPNVIALPPHATLGADEEFVPRHGPGRQRARQGSVAALPSAHRLSSRLSGQGCQPPPSAL